MVVFYKNKDLDQMTKNDRKEIKTRQANLEKLKKKINDLIRKTLEEVSPR